MPRSLPQLMLAILSIGLLFEPAVGDEGDLDPRPVRQSTMTYKEVGERALQVDFFVPTDDTKGDEPRPVIAFFHGGGWVFGDRSVYHAACRHFAAEGFATCTFEYRLSRNSDGSYPHPQITPVESVKDARSAIRWLRREADALGIDANRIAAWGRSAGGQLVWSTALCDSLNESSDDTSISPVPNALLTFSACYNTVQTWCERMLGEKRKQIWEISPHHQLKAGLPPAIGFHGKEDITEPLRVAVWFRDKTTQMGNPFELVILDGEGHALSNAPDPPGEMRNAELLKRVETFLREEGLHPTGERASSEGP